MHFRYVDNLYVFAKTEERLLDVVEKMVKNLRKDGLIVNEKISPTKIESSDFIEKERFFSEYREDLGDDEFEIEGESTEFERISNTMPETVSFLINSNTNKDDERYKIRELKYFLSHSNEQSLFLDDSIIRLINIKPSLTVNIIRYLSRILSGGTNNYFMENYVSPLWQIYTAKETTDWARFWVLKQLMLIEPNTTLIKDLLQKKSEENEVYAILFMYFLVLKKEEIRIEKLEKFIENASSPLVKAHFLFFLTYTKDTKLKSKFFSLIEPSLNSPEHDLNLISFAVKKNLYPSLICQSSTFIKYLNNEVILEKDFSKKQENDGYFILKGNVSKINEEDFSMILGTKKRNYNPKGSKSFIENSTIEKEFEKLAYWTDGRITYDVIEIKMRPQIKDLCRLFIDRAKNLVTYDDIRSSIISSRRQDITENSTISKYVHELCVYLENYSKVLQIKTSSKEGYILTKK